MKLAVMQPYLFPYIGYFQLIYASDLFLIYDDVNYIKRGYINRNSIGSVNGAVRFTVPVPSASQNKLISELSYSSDVAKILKTIEQSYSKSKYFSKVYPIIKDVLESEDRRIASVCLNSYKLIMQYLDVDINVIKSSDVEYDRSGSAADKLIELCRVFGANNYINSPGGKEIYSKCYFEDKGIDLRFIKSLPVSYNQVCKEFVPNLSIIDVLMNCSPQEVVSLLGKIRLE